MALEALADSYARWRQYSNIIDQEGPFTTLPNGILVCHPAMGAANKALANLTRLMLEFGVTPASRSKVPAVTPKKESPWDAFQK
jgi:P27 family predicted phage terminase small subunit